MQSQDVKEIIGTVSVIFVQGYLCLLGRSWYQRGRMGGGSLVVCLLWDNGMGKLYQQVQWVSDGVAPVVLYPKKIYCPPFPRDKCGSPHFSEGQYLIKTCSVNQDTSYQRPPKRMYR